MIYLITIFLISTIVVGIAFFLLKRQEKIILSLKEGDNIFYYKDNGVIKNNSYNFLQVSVY